MVLTLVSLAVCLLFTVTPHHFKLDLNKTNSLHDPFFLLTGRILKKKKKKEKQ